MDQRTNLDHNYVNVTAVHLHSAAYLHVDSHILVALGEDDLEREGWGGEAMRVSGIRRYQNSQNIDVYLYQNNRHQIKRIVRTGSNNTPKR